MKKYIYKSTYLTGEFEFVYDDEGWLHSFTFERAKPTKKQRVFTLQNLPIVEQNFRPFFESPTGTITEVKEDVTFEMFWQRYFNGRQKDNSSKKKAEIKWNRMGEADRVAAYNHINRYMANIPYGTVPKLAETYLNSEVWNN